MDKYKIKLMPKAVRDLDAIYEYIKTEFQEIKTAEKIEMTIQRLQIIHCNLKSLYKFADL